MLLRILGRMEEENGDDDNMIRFSFSSEMPVDRAMGDEVLDHGDGSVRLDRLNNGAPLLFNHDSNQLVGVVERAYVKDRRGYAEARYSSSAFAQQIKDDVRNGVIRNVSVGYRILRVDNHDKRQTDEYRVTEWEPLELSLVTIPADPTVGVGRSLVDKEPLIVKQSRDKMEQQQSLELHQSAIANERNRVRTITALGTKFARHELADQLVESGKTVEEARAAFLDVLQTAGQIERPVQSDSSAIDLNKREQRDYSVVRAIRACVNNTWNEAGLEREVSDTLAKQIGRETQGFFIPHNIPISTRNTQSVTSYSTGGALVAENLLAASFIDLLRNTAIITQLGPTVLTGLTGNVSIPRQRSASTMYWVAEDAAVTQSGSTYDTMTLMPKQAGVLSRITRLAMQQTSPDIEQLVRNDIAQQLALGIDLAIINGSGSNGQPLGLLQVPLANASQTVSATSITNLDPLITLETEVDVLNALNGSLYYLTNSAVIGHLKKLKASSTGAADRLPLWTNNLLDPAGRGILPAINGYPIVRSNQVPTNFGGTANRHCIIFGNFADVVMAMWGGTEILPNPYGTGYAAGSIDLRIMQTFDCGIRRPESFSRIRDLQIS